MKQTAEFTFETSETIVIHQPDLVERRHCPYCHELVDMIAPFLISTLLGITEREIFRMIECGHLYSFESGRLRVCLRCLETEKKKKLCEI